MEGQTQHSEATPHLPRHPRHPRQYQAEVREASIDELAHDDLYGGGNQPRHATLSPEGEEAKDAENSQWIADYITEEPIDFAQELESTSAGHQQPTTTRNDDKTKQEIVYLCDHRGSRFAFPFEQCSSREATAQLWEELYTTSDLNHQDKQSYLDKLIYGEYRIQTPDGITISTSAWKSLVKPDSTIKIAFATPSRRVSRRQSRLQPQNNSRLETGADNSGKELALRSEVMGSAPPFEESENSIITEDNSSENDTSSSVSDMSLRGPLILGPNRYALHAVDFEGNKLSFQVQTKPPTNIVATSEESNNPEYRKETRADRKEPAENHLEIRRITRAVAVETDAQNILAIHTLPSLASTRLQASVTTTWYHIYGRHLDFRRFENVCFAIPNLSDRLQTLTREVLIKLRDEKMKPFVGGRYIEPGTVLRADGFDATDSQSVIFSCVPYFSLQEIAKSTPEREDLLCPPRTLMQALYPYESVRERDEEQSYRKFGDEANNNIVHVPSLWIMNIGSAAIVTYGHEPLPAAIGNAISIVEEDIRCLGKQSITENALTKIHIVTTDGRSLIYPIGTFRSWFQFESWILCNDSVPEGRVLGVGLKLKVRNMDAGTTAGPGNWKTIISRAAQLVSISIELSDSRSDEETAKEAPTPEPAAVSSPIAVPPFFHWVQSETNNLAHRVGKAVITGASEEDRSIVCLEYVHKTMMSKFLVHSNSPVEDAFKTNHYYYFLSEKVYAGVSTRVSELQDLINTTSPPESGSINHKMIVSTHCHSILVRSVEFLNTVRKTLDLFVDDLDSSSVLRKLSSALQNIHEHVRTIERHGPIEPDPEEYINPQWEHPDMKRRAWSIRTSAWEVPSSLPDSMKTLQRSVLRCRRCRDHFKSAKSAMAHLVQHVKKYSAGNAHPNACIPSYTELQDWIINSVQYRRELTNASALVILTHASEISTELFGQLRELAEGVQNEDGQMSSLYTLPQQLINAFRKIVVFYLVIERALYENGQAYRLDDRYQSSHRLTNAPYSPRDVEVLKRFGSYAKWSLLGARFRFCMMARPESSSDLRKHLSLGPEYVSLWFMRRLLMTPLERSKEQSKTIGDMYHVYISKVQFEINHRPSKRLLRAINLIQEELQVLQLVNTWQINLINNYLEVIDYSTYEKIIPARRAMYLFEHALGVAFLDHLSLVRQDYADLIRRCAPLSDRTKQILEINEEDHGKAIMVFTVVTVIFLPLSFVTSYFGMNASDIRDMDETQAVFWSVAIPLTCVTVGSCLLIGYNGDSIRDLLSSMYRKMTKKESGTVEAAGITVSQRQGPSKSRGGLDSIFDSFGPAEDDLRSRRRDLYRADYNDDDNDHAWTEKDNQILLDKYTTPAYPSGPYPSGDAPKRQSSYPDPNRSAMQVRRKSLYPDPYPSDRKSSRNEYDRTPYMPYKNIARDRPRRTETTNSRYIDSTNPFSPINSHSPSNPYADDGTRSRPDIFDHRRSISHHPLLSLPPPRPPPGPPPPRPPPRMSTNYTTMRSRSKRYDDDEDEWYTRRPDVEVGSRYVRRGRSRSQSRGRDWSSDGEPVRRVHYADGPGERIRHRNRGESSDSNDVYRDSGRPRRRREQEYGRREEGSRRYRR